MSKGDDDEEWGLTEADRRLMGEWTEGSSAPTEHHARGDRGEAAQHGVGDGVDLALTYCPEGFGGAKLLVAAWLFEHGASTAMDVIEETGLSSGTVYGALNTMHDEELVHTDHLREYEGQGQPPTVYVPVSGVVDRGRVE